MGSVRKDIRSPGWQARYRDRSGRQRTRTFLTKGEARTFLGTVETDLAKGTWTDPALAKVRFSTYTTRWRQSLAHLRPGTLNNVDSFLHCHILPGFGTWQIGRIEPADIRIFVAELVEKGLAPSTVAAVYRVLARILATAEIDGVIARYSVSRHQAAPPDDLDRAVLPLPSRGPSPRRGHRGPLPGARLHRRLHRHALGRARRTGCPAARSTPGDHRGHRSPHRGQRPRPNRADQDRQEPNSLDTPLPRRAPRRAPGDLSLGWRVRVQLRRRNTASPELLPPPLQACRRSAPGSPIPSVSTTSATPAQPSSSPRAPTRRRSRSGSGTPPSSSPSTATGTCSRALMSDCGTDSTPPGGPSRMLKSRAASWWNCGGRGCANSPKAADLWAI